MSFIDLSVRKVACNPFIY